MSLMVNMIQAVEYQIHCNLRVSTDSIPGVDITSSY